MQTKIVKNILILIIVIAFANVNAQERIDGVLPFQNDPAKKYSIYIPSNYDVSVPNELLLGLHPLNVNRWDATSWCDTLINFAEMNQLLVVCPDGGSDGAVDDAIDTAFTSLILDSMEIWYNVDPDQIYAAGFSWGGLTTYTYGLNRFDRFAGFMPIGAAINGFAVINSISQNAKDKAFYIVHGSLDNPNTRFYPLVTGLESEGACVESNLLTGVGHTIDFENRDAILTEGLNWLRNQNCGVSSSDEIEKAIIQVLPNPIRSGQSLQVKMSDNQTASKIKLIDINGHIIAKVEGDHFIIPRVSSGIYFLQILSSSGVFEVQKLYVSN